LVTARLLEREHELAELEGALHGALSDEGRAVVVQGTAGIGKTALLDVAAKSARDQGIEVLVARADSLESDLSFGVCMQLFQRLAEASGEDGPDPFAGAAAFARPVLGGGSVMGAPGEDRTLPLINGLYWLCANLAERGPLLLSVDDAHWSDLPSLQFLHFLARRLEGLPVALAVAARPVDPRSSVGELLARLANRPEAALVRPEGLSAAAVARVIESELGGVAPEFAEACLRLSGGNPLYLLELLRSARASGLEPTRGNADELAGLRPERIADSVLARVGGIGDEARRLAEIAAVGGGRLHLRDAARLAEVGVDRAQRSVDALADAAILARGDPLAFAHPLVHASIYESIPDAARAGMHARLAGLLRDSGASHEAIAAHLLSAEPRADAWALDELQAAATDAMGRGSPAAAARYLGRALEEGPAGARRGEILVGLGLAETEAGDPGGAERLTLAVELLPAPEARAGVLLGLGMTLTMQGNVAQATAAYERGITEVTGAQGAVARDLEALCAVGLVHDLDARAAALPRMEALLEDPEIDQTPTGRMLLAQAAAERAYQRGSLADLEALVGRALAPGSNDDDPAAFWTYFFAAYAYDDADEYERADAAIDRALELARRRGSVVQAAAACHPRAFVNARRGRIDAALADARTSIEGAEQGWQVALPSSRAVLAEAHLERGELDEAVAATELPGGDEPWTRLFSYAWLLAARARVQLEVGEPVAALATFRRCGEICEAAVLTNPSVISWRSGAALAAVAIDERDQAEELAREELRLAREFGAPRAIGIALRTLGLVLGGEAAIEPLREATAVLEGSEARLEHARALVDLGGALRRAGQRREAREPLREGLDLAHRCGAVAIAERARAELEASGARPRRYELTGVESLTPSERRIAAMAAEGFTNPQIAQALFLTRRTVEMHLTNAYRKLDIASRTELPAALGSPAP
jgi:DNA-binding CsgD family transcriptional regulator